MTSDERSAETLSAIAGGDVARETTSREYAHDTSITRTAEEYTLTLDGDRGSEEGLFGRSTTAGLPVDGRGNYRFGAFSSHDRELLRGLLEGCGTVCFKSSQGTVGISFVHDDRDLLETVRDLLGDCPVDPPLGDLSETSSGGYWFGVDDDAAPELGRWLYDDCEETGLYAPAAGESSSAASSRRKASSDPRCGARARRWSVEDERREVRENTDTRTSYEPCTTRSTTDPRSTTRLSCWSATARVANARTNRFAS